MHAPRSAGHVAALKEHLPADDVAEEGHEQRRRALRGEGGDRSQTVDSAAVAAMGLDPRSCQKGREHGDAYVQPRLLEEIQRCRRLDPRFVPATFVDEDERLVPQRRDASKDVADRSLRLTFAQVLERGVGVSGQPAGDTQLRERRPRACSPGRPR